MAAESVLFEQVGVQLGLVRKGAPQRTRRHRGSSASTSLSIRRRWSGGKRSPTSLTWSFLPGLGFAARAVAHVEVLVGPDVLSPAITHNLEKAGPVTISDPANRLAHALDDLEHIHPIQPLRRDPWDRARLRMSEAARRSRSRE